ncbi:MAG: hypothetical protein ACTSUR_06245 [Candidatus Heimdallarchaeaceae archaeon]
MSKREELLPTIRAQKEGVNWKKTMFYSLLLLSILLLISALAILSYSSIYKENTLPLTNTTTSEYNTRSPDSFKGVLFAGNTITIGAVVTIGLSFFGMISVFAGKYASQNLIFENEAWWKKWSKHAEISIDDLRRKVVMETKEGKLSITKSGANYLIQATLEDKEQLKGFGFKEEKDSLYGLFTKAELVSILYVCFSIFKSKTKKKKR